MSLYKTKQLHVFTKIVQTGPSNGEKTSLLPSCALSQHLQDTQIRERNRGKGGARLSCNLFTFVACVDNISLSVDDHISFGLRQSHLGTEVKERSRDTLN